MRNRIVDSLLQDICEEEGIELTGLSYGWILQLKKNGRTRHIIGSNFDLNGEASAKIVCDKSACYQVLTGSGVPAAEHRLLIDPAGVNSMHSAESIWKTATRFLEQQGGSAVLKPNDGKMGNQVFLCHTQAQLEWAVHTIFKTCPSLCLCPYYDVGYEYRVFYVDGQCRHTYAKEKPHVIGDGERTVSLLAHLGGIPIEDPGVDPQYIPVRGEKVFLSWKHNLSRGAKALEVEDQAVVNRLYSLASRAAEAVNIRYGTVDIIELTDGRQMVLEINSSVAVRKYVEQYPERYETAKEIYRAAVRAMFS